MQAILFFKMHMHDKIYLAIAIRESLYYDVTQMWGLDIVASYWHKHFLYYIPNNHNITLYLESLW